MKQPVALVTVLLCLAPFRAYALSPKAIIKRTLEHDHWGLSGAKVEATALLVDRRKRKRKLVFKAISKKWKAHLTKSLVRFHRPPDLAGAGFLQVQNDDRDDDRFIYLPALKRTRRVAASQRSTSFMGTDFNFADIDRRDWRQGRYKKAKDTKIGRFPCHHIIIYPRRRDSPYSRIEVDIRKDNFVPLKIRLFDHAKVHTKTLDVFQVRRVSGQWFISKSRMTDLKESRSTTLHLTKIKPAGDIPDSRFTKKSLER
jgi:hypothetical protein